MKTTISKISYGFVISARVCVRKMRDGKERETLTFLLRLGLCHVGDHTGVLILCVSSSLWTGEFFEFKLNSWNRLRNGKNIISYNLVMWWWIPYNKTTTTMIFSLISLCSSLWVWLILCVSSLTVVNWREFCWIHQIRSSVAPFVTS